MLQLERGRDRSVRGLRHRLARGAASAFVINGVGVGIAFAAQLIAARLLGVDSYGVFSFVLAWALLLTAAATLGFETGLVRFAAPYHDQCDLGRLRGVIRFAEARVIVAGLVCAGLAMLVVVLDVGPSISDELRWTFLLALPAVPLWALMRVRLSAVRAFGQVARALIPDKIAREATFISVLVLVAIMRPDLMTGPAAGTALTLGAGVSLLLITFWGRQAAPDGLATTAPLSEDRALWARTAWPLWLLTLSQLAMRRIDVLVLGMLIGTQASGIYFACFVTAQVIVFPLVAVNFLFTPTIAALHAAGDHAALQRAVTSTSWWTTTTAILAGVPILLLAPDLLALFGTGFMEHADVLRVLVLGQLVNAAAGSIVPLLSMTGGERDAMSISLIAFAGRLSLLLLLIPAFGILGAAIVETVFRIGWNFAMGVAIWRRIRILPSILSSFCSNRELFSARTGRKEVRS
jgi:O-antigen/teichoic acid export membrane protein